MCATDAQLSYLSKIQAYMNNKTILKFNLEKNKFLFFYVGQSQQQTLMAR